MRAIDDDPQPVEPSARAERSPSRSRYSGRPRPRCARRGRAGRAPPAGRRDRRASAPRSRAPTSSDSLNPSGPNSLMPLSSNGLCEAEIMTPRSARRLRVSMAMAGVGSGPDQHHVHARADEARDQRRLDHVAREPRVLADDDPVAMRRRARNGARPPGRGAARSRRSWGRCSRCRGCRPCRRAAVLSSRPFTRAGPRRPALMTRRAARSPAAGAGARRTRRGSAPK